MSRPNFASSLLIEGVFDEAARLFEGVIERKLDVYPSLRYRDLAEAYIGLKRPDQALDAATRAIEMCGDTMRDVACALGYDIRAAVHLARNDRVAALADLQRALAGIEDARKRLIPADFFKQQFGRTSTTLFGRAIKLQLSEGRAAEALETAEQARARAFLDLLGSRSVALTPKAAAVLNDNTSRRRSEFTAPSPKIDERPRSPRACSRRCCVVPGSRPIASSSGLSRRAAASAPRRSPSVKRNWQISSARPPRSERPAATRVCRPTQPRGDRSMTC